MVQVIERSVGDIAAYGDVLRVRCTLLQTSVSLVFSSASR